MPSAGNFDNADYEFIADNLFDVVKDLSVVELGSGNGTFHTLQLEKRVSKLLCVEYNLVSLYMLRNVKTNKMDILHADYHQAVRTLGEYDAAVLLGILYHSHAPMALLEDVVNFVKPRIIIMDAIHDGPIEVVVNEEIPDSNSMNRQIAKKTKCSNMVFSISQTIYKQALSNLGYDCVKTLEYKQRYYLVFKSK